MDHLFYQYALCAALPIMIFIGLFFLLNKKPDRSVYKDYFRSRSTMGAAMLVLSANYAVHLTTGIRFTDPNAAILLNLSTYFLCYWLFSSALMTLLDKLYLTVRRIAVHMLLWIVYTCLSAYVLFIVPMGSAQDIGTLTLAACLLCYGIWLSTGLIRTYKKLTRGFKDIHSEKIENYMKWMNVITYWAVIFGVGCGLLTFLPDGYLFVWVLSSIPFYAYLFRCYQNYLLFYERVEQALEADEEMMRTDCSVSEQDKPQYYASISKNMNAWMEMDAYTQPGFTINDMAKMLDTNRTYLSAYIKDIYNLSFRDWISELRLEYAKRMLKKNPDMSVKKVAEASGFLSLSHFIKMFTEKEGQTPAKWRKS